LTIFETPKIYRIISKESGYPDEAKSARIMSNSQVEDEIMPFKQLAPFCEQSMT